MKFKLVFGSDKALDRFDLESVSQWLTGHNDYQWLSIDQPDLIDVEFRCIVESLTPITNGWVPVAFEASIICDCPYAYGHTFSESHCLSGESEIYFRNNGTVRDYLRPLLSIHLNAGETSLAIQNKDDSLMGLEFHDLPPVGLDFTIDTSNGIITEKTGEYNLYECCNLTFPRFIPGDNHLLVSGNGTLTISGRTYHNVGA